MDETIFPPSVNWFLSKNLTCNEDGSIAYGAKNSVIILHDNARKNLSPSVIDNAHDLRVTAVCFPPKNCCENMQSTIVSSGEDGHVKLWDLNSSTLLAAQKLHWDAKEQKGKVTCLDWSQAQPELVVSAGANDTLVCWNILTNAGTKFHFPRMQPVVVLCRPDDGKIVAVGSRQGLVFVVNLIEGGKILFKLRGHDSEVQSLSWCPVNRNVFRTANSEERLLATSCKDQDIYVWRAGTDGGCETILRLPSGPISKSAQEKQRFKGTAASTFVALFWAGPQMIFSNTVFGELVCCRLEKYVRLRDIEDGSKKQTKSKIKDVWESAHDYHSRGIFAICGIQSQESPSNERTDLEGGVLNGKIVADSNDENLSETWSGWVWSAGSDQKLIACKFHNGRCELIRNFNTLNGFPYCAAASPHDPNRIAIAAGDGIVRLWNLTETTGELHIFWQKIKDKVMSIEWHPSRDGLLAYGTSEGRVGCIETQSTKMPTLFKIAHPQPVYRLSWGPFFQKKGDVESNGKDFALYSVSNNSIFQYDLSKPERAPLNVSKIVDFACMKQTDICWKPDNSLLAVGNDDGTICLLSPPHLESVIFVSPYKKTIQSIAWHPDCTVFDRDVSPYRGYFTCGTTDKDNDIQVFNVSTGEKGIFVEKVALLKGHKDYLQHVSWNPHVGGRLVSSSADFSVRIWDVISQSLLVAFAPNKSRMCLFSVWSPVDPDLIITGCRDKILLVWRISTTEACELPNLDKSKKKKKMKKSSTAKTAVTEISLGLKNVNQEFQVAGEEKCLGSAEPENSVKEIKESKIFSRAWKGKPDEPKNCYELLKKNENDSEFNLGFLGNQSQWTEVIDNEMTSKRRSNSWQEVYELSLWRGSLKETVEEGIKNGRLTDFLVSLTPMVSPRLWQEACTAYSKNLAEKKQYRKAASYLVACHKVKEAVRLLVDADLFLEALCMARSRYDGDDAEIKNIIEKYARWLSKTGSFTRACECFIYLKDYVEAAKIMAKRNEAEYLSVAALAAKMGGSDRLESSCAINGIIKCLYNRNWDLARNICDDHFNLKHLKILYHMYDSICKLYDAHFELKQDILYHVKNLTGIEADDESYAALQYPYDKNVFYKNKQELMMCVARELSLSCCATNRDTALSHVIQALAASSRYVPEEEAVDRPLFKVCSWLAPSGFLVEDSVFIVKDTFESKTKSLRAFLCEALIEEIEKTTSDSSTSETFKTLEALKGDLFDPENVRYFKNLVRIKTYEKKLMDVRFIKKKAQKELSGADTVESEEAGKHYESASVDLNILNELKKEVEEFEARRIICPNPVISYCKIRNVVQHFLNGQDLLREIEDSPFGKSLICDD